MYIYILFIFGFVFLIKGADYLVEGASSIAERYNVSDLVIGLTIVAFGTSTPELFVNITASIGGRAEIAIGNVLGSNVANILLILGVSSLIYPLTVTRGTVWKEIPFSLLAVFVLALLVNDALIDRMDFFMVGRSDGMVLLCFFIIFIYYSFSIAGNIEGMEEQIPKKKHRLSVSLLLIIAGLAGLMLGGKWIVDGAVKIALDLGMSQNLVGLTIVAVGTSLPELATSAMAAYRKNVEIAVGNVVGSNIFNILFVLGISSVIKPLPFEYSNNMDIVMVIIASVMLFISMFTGKKRSLDRTEGILFIMLYIGYISFLIYRG